MELKIEARTNRITPVRGKASVHISFDGNSGLTVSNIEIRVENGKVAVKMPPAGRRPDIAFQGEIKRQIEQAVRTQFLMTAYDGADFSKDRALNAKQF